MDSLVSTEWLANEMGASDLRIVDATKFLPDHGRNALAEYEAGHIPGAVFMDLEELVDSNSPIDNTLPPPEKFASRMQSLGLGDGSRIVLYDDSPLKSSARAWFMLTMFGAHAVAILDGGIAKWKAEGRPLKSGKEALRHRHFTVWKTARTCAPRPTCSAICTARPNRSSMPAPPRASPAQRPIRAPALPQGTSPVRSTSRTPACSTLMAPGRPATL